MKRILILSFVFVISNLASAQSVKLKQAIPNKYNTWVKYVNDSNIYASRFTDGGEILHYNGYSWKSHKRTHYPTIFEQEVTADGKIWLGTSAGLYSIDTALQNQTYDQNPVVIGGFQITDSVKQIVSIENKLWFTTNTYLACIQNQKISIYNQDTLPYLADLPKIADLIVDNNGSVLLATPKGLVKIHPNQKEIDFFEFHISSFHKDVFGEIWFTALDTKTLYRWNNGQPILINTPACDNVFSAVGNITSNQKGDIFIWAGVSFVSVNGTKKKHLSGIYSTYEQRFYVKPLTYPNPLTIGFFSVESQVGFYTIKETGDSIFEFNLDSVKRVLNTWDEFSTELNANNINMPILSDGLFGWNKNRKTTYFPKNECKSIISSGSLWLGGAVNENKKVVAQTYSRIGSDFYPGPIRKLNGELVIIQQQSNQSAYSKPKKVTKAAIDKFISDFAAGGPILIPQEILNWPAHGDTLKGEAYYLAPFVDVNRDGNYNPHQGDYPDIKGDMAIYSIINDYGPHVESNSKPFGVEIHLMAYAYACADISSKSPEQVLNNAVFFQYKIINRSDANYKSIKPGIFMDIDIGNQWDDYLACNPKIGYTYGFNGDAFDENYPSFDKGYGNRPPTISVVPLGLDSSAAYLRGMMACRYEFSNSIYNPTGPEPYNNFLNTKFFDNTQLTYGGLGNDTTSTPTTYMFPGDDDLLGRPHWSMESAGLSPYDVRMVSLLTPFDLSAGADTTFTVAFVASLPLDSASTYKTIKDDVLKVKGWFAKDEFPTCGKLISGVKEQLNNKDEVLVYPNPAQQFIRVKHTFKGLVEAEILSIDGKILWSGKLDTTNEINIQHLTSGMYLLHLSNQTGSKTIKWLKE